MRIAYLPFGSITVYNMARIIMWFISFISLYFTIVWLFFIFLKGKVCDTKKIQLPFVTLAVPAYNEEKTIIRTIESLLLLDYPQQKYEIIIIDDGSTDSTSTLVQNFMQKNADAPLIFIHQKNKGKAAALNNALSHARGTLFACVDADSTVDPKALRPMIPHFQDPRLGAVISIIKVRNTKNIYARMQRIEYTISAFTRRLMARIQTLAMTPGVLSVYKTNVLFQIGKFAENNMTEDFEIALRLKYHGFLIAIEPESITYTDVPSTFHKLARQRIRWFRGFITNHVIYKDMFFNKKYATFGFFQLPLNILGVLILLLSTTLIAITIMLDAYEFSVRSLLITDYFGAHVFIFPSLKEFFLGQDLQIMIPITIASFLGFYFMYLAHKEIKEKIIRFPVSIWLYLVVFPYLTTFHWLSAITQEILRMKKKW